MLLAMNYSNQNYQFMQKSLIFLFLSLSTICFAKQDYSEYHLRVKKIEKLIIKHSFKKALVQYESIFDDYDFVFQRDYKIAIQLTAFINDTANTYRLMREGVVHGISLSELKKLKVLKPLQKGSSWKKLENDYPQLRREYWNTKNREIKSELNQMFKEDQKIALNALFRIGKKSRNRFYTDSFAPYSEKHLKAL